MRKCRICGKKISLFDGYKYRVKRYCKDCYSKRNKSDKVSKDIKTDNKKEQEKNYWLIGALIGLGLFIFIFSGFNSNNKEYSDCISDCISDVTYCPTYEYGKELCVSYEGSSIDKYISKYDYDSCVNELESCVSSCELKDER